MIYVWIISYCIMGMITWLLDVIIPFIYPFSVFLAAEFWSELSQELLQKESTILVDIYIK